VRDAVLLLFMVGALPVALIHPIVGVYLWTWLGVMNPHRLTWGFSVDFPFALLTALATMIGLVVTKDRRRMPIAPPTVALAAFLIWMSLGYPFALFPDPSAEMWNKVMKIQLMTLVAAALIVEREHVKRLAWVLVISLGFYGVKGGIFTIVNAGAFKVWGPAGTFIEGNNEIALALIMVIPLMWYLFEATTARWIRFSLIAAMALTALAALGSQSRGALVAITAMTIAIWWYSKRKVMLGIGLLMLAPALLAFMPDMWDQRMQTIADYENDGSAMGRINAWRMAWNLATDRPMFGGGFDIYNSAVFGQYAPIPTDIHAAHSIYFQVLGEHGFVGLFLFLLMWWLTWRTAVWIRKNTKPKGETAWAHHLAAMSQVSLIGYFVGGAFLSLAYFDLPYYILVLLVATQWILKRESKSSPVVMPAHAAGDSTGAAGHHA
jgi:probable O-glycosylation ligase (exosortase A-associated)